jgi:hypothetical protein
MDCCRATGLYTASFIGKAGFSRRHIGLRDRIYIPRGHPRRPPRTPGIRAPSRDARPHRRAARKALGAGAPAPALHCEAGGAAPPREAVRVVDNVRTTRPDLIVLSRGPGGTRMLIEVGSIAFDMSRYSPPDSTWMGPRGRSAARPRQRRKGAPRRGRHRRGGIRRCGAPVHANPDLAHGRHELRGHFCEHSPTVHELRASGQVRRHDRQGNGKEATAYQRHHIRQWLATGAAMARLPRKQNSAPAPALRGPQHRVRAHASPPAGAGRTVESQEK